MTERNLKNRPIIELTHNGDPYGRGFTGRESVDNGKSWFYRGDIGARTRQWWRHHCCVNDKTLREVQQ